MKKPLRVLLIIASLTAVATAAKQPNIIILLADDLGWTDLAGSHTSLGNGSKYYQTPQLDRLAQQGMTFSSMYVNQNCAPTRAALISGQYAPRTGIFNVGSLDRGAKDTAIMPPQQNTVLRSEAVTIAETLKAAGYVTAHFGKWHLGPADLIHKVHGFDFNYSRADAPDGRQRRGGGEGRGRYFAVQTQSGEWRFSGYGSGMRPFAQPYTVDYIAKYLQPYVNGNDPKTLAGTPKHLTDAMADATADFLAVQWPKAGKDKPFFMHVAFNQVHVPIEPRPDMLAKYEKLMSSDPRHQRANYAAFVDHLDQVAGRIIDQLEDPNGDGDKSDSIANNTVVFFMSDNGGGISTSNVPLRGQKGMLVDGGVRVPLIVRWAGVVEPGTTSAEALHAVDIYLTCAEIGGAALPETELHPLDGESFTGILRGIQTESKRNAIYWHFPGYMDTRAVPTSSIIKDYGADRYKLFYFYEPRRYELYKLSDDISEKTDLFAGTPSAQTIAVANDLRNDLLAWLARMKPPAMTFRATGESVPPPVPFAEAVRGTGSESNLTAGALKQRSGRTRRASATFK